ncbi:hypothetical protein L2E82_49847 [Cichorium intybus]|uniref:Uncharacterized protein n=1 Tax=Cichorium intybus TaxID=13427 RepID=A0ACB8Z204_CICIN|nr:hypothetical protein L2E82_49847 [Cichorium intybus]
MDSSGLIPWCGFKEAFILKYFGCNRWFWAAPALRGSMSAGGMEDHGSSCVFETEIKVVDDVQTSLDDWCNARVDQQGLWNGMPLLLSLPLSPPFSV